MKKIITILLAFLIGNFSFTYGAPINHYRIPSQFDNSPIESIYVHQNSSFLFSGEQLLYKIYCLNSNTNNLSRLSKIAYVELISSQKKMIFRHKIKLTKGLGQGEFIIPKSISSGAYKLVAYTQSMKNFGHELFFKSDLTLINPYNSKKTTSNNNYQGGKTHNILQNEPLKIIKKEPSSLQNSKIQLTTNASTFKNREKVVLKLQSLENNYFGNYSLSVRKVDSIQGPKRRAFDSFKPINPSAILNLKTEKSKYIPELRGELISGKITHKNSKLPAVNINIAISIPGSHPILKIVTTNQLGVFNFNIDKDYDSNTAIIQVLSDDSEKFSIHINKPLPINYEHISFYDFKISPEIKDYILKRHIYNQIENVYASFRPNHIKKIDSIHSFLNSETLIYNLDDYKRFSTLKETVVEIIPEIFTTTKNKKSYFHIKFNNQLNESSLLPIIIVDGILIQNHNNLIDFNSKTIKRILINRKNYIYNTQIFEGIISIETIDGDYGMKNSFSGIGKKITLFKPLAITNYHNQSYDGSNKYDRIPDYRSQLLWEPNFVLNKKEQTITFFTSDNYGDYEICLEGFTNEGYPVSLRKTIKIEK